MKSSDYNYNNNSIAARQGMPVLSKGRIRNPYHEKKVLDSSRSNAYKMGANPVISGYFVKEKSYKEIIISRINAALCGVLAFLVMVCLISYYFVVTNEIELRQLSKDTIALNFDNSDLQNKLDNLQSFSNVDFQVSKLNILQRAKQVIELSAADLPDVRYDKGTNDLTVNRYLGY